MFLLFPIPSFLIFYQEVRRRSEILRIGGGASTDQDAVGVIGVARAVLLRPAVEGVIGRGGRPVAEPVAGGVVGSADHLVGIIIRQILDRFFRFAYDDWALSLVV